MLLIQYKLKCHAITTPEHRLQTLVLTPMAKHKMNVHHLMASRGESSHRVAQYARHERSYESR